VIVPNVTVSEPFNIANGDRLDLTQILAGAPLAQDLSNIGNYMKVLGYAGADQNGGTVLEIMGPNGNSQVTLQGAGKVSVDDLVNNSSLVLPPH
jgi:hypothetical protein